jgi:hypothetical protein
VLSEGVLKTFVSAVMLSATSSSKSSSLIQLQYCLLNSSVSPLLLCALTRAIIPVHTSSYAVTVHRFDRAIGHSSDIALVLIRAAALYVYHT